MSAFTRATIAFAAVAAAACSSGGGDQPVLNAKPDYIKSAIASTTYDGGSNDLLTAGLGKSGLQEYVLEHSAAHNLPPRAVAKARPPRPLVGR